jgi:sugar phosphate isomerase/epimerase
MSTVERQATAGTVSRRGFFGTLAAAAALPRLAQASGRTAAPSAAEPALILGVASYSLRKLPLDDVLQAADTFGVTHMTFKDVHIPRTGTPEETRALRRRIEAAGITIMGGGTITMKNEPDQLRKDFEYARDAGMPLIYASPDPAALDAIEQLVREFDIKFAIHNHGPEDQWWPAPQDAYKALESRDKRMGLCIDVGHTIRTGTDPVQACVECQDRLYDMHVKDLADKTDRDSQVAVGRGVIDFPALFTALMKIGYRGQVGLEYEIFPDDPIPGMRESLGYMRGVLAGISEG